ncbi:glycosyltransferase family 4 protein, partial [Chloroflexota bacterium]
MRDHSRKIDNKFLIIIEDRSQINELLAQAEQRKAVEASIEVISMNRNVNDELQRLHVKSKTLDDYGLSEEYLEEEGMKWFKSFPSIKIRNGKDIKELLAYNGISIWWLLDEVLYRSPYLFKQLQATIKHLIAFEYIVKVEKPSRIYYINNDSCVSKVLDFVCREKSIRTAKAASSPGIRQALSNWIKVKIFQYGPLLHMLVRKVYWIILTQIHPRVKKITKNARLLMFLGDHLRDVHDPTTGKIKKGDLYFDSVLDLLRKDYDVVSVGHPTIIWSISIIKEQMQNPGVIYYPFENYLSIKVLMKAVQAAIKIHKIYQHLAKTSAFQQSLNLYGIPVYDLIKQKLALFFSSSFLLRIVAYIEMVNNLVATERPNAILLGDGATADRALIAVAKGNGIPTIVTMHGYALTPYVPRFNHIADDIGPRFEATSPYCPMADKYIVYGEYDKDMMIRRAMYPEEDIIIGVPRYDILAKADKL